MYVERLLDRLPPHVRREILDEALPAGALSGADAPATHADLERQTAAMRGRLLARVLRMVDASDEEIAGLARDGYLAPRTPNGDVETVTVTFVSRDGEAGLQGVPPAAGGVALPLLAASTMFLTEVAVRARAATLPIGAGMATEDAAVIAPSNVRVAPGSVEINLGGGLFASGVGLLVACAAGMITAPVVGPVAGVALLTGGAIEMALDWRKKAVETAKLQEELRIVQRDNGAFAEWQQRELRSLELERKRLELRKEELEVQQRALGLEEQKRALALPPAAAHAEAPPPSALVSLRVIQAEAAAHGVSEAYAVHLVNRVLPTVSEGLRRFDDVRARRG